MNAPTEPPNSSLMSLVDCYVTALGAIDGETGEVPDDVHAVLLELSPRIEERVDACAAVIARYEAEAEALDALAKAYHARSVARANEAKRLRAYVARELQRAQLERVRGAVHHAYFQATPHVEIDSVEALPAKYMREVPATRVPDKRGLLAALKAGEEIAGARLVTEKHLRLA